MTVFICYRFGRVQIVKILKQKGGGDHHGLDACTNATVAFMDIKSANKAHSVEHKIEDRLLRTDYYDPSSSSNSTPSQHYNTNNSSSTTSSGGTGSNSSASLNSRLHPEDGPGPGPGPGGGGSNSSVSGSDLYNENHNRSSHFVGDRLGSSGSNSVGGGSIRDRIGERGNSGGNSGSNMAGSDFHNQNSSSHRNSSNNERRYGQDEDFSRQRSVRSVGYRSNIGYNSDK